MTAILTTYVIFPIPFLLVVGMLLWIPGFGVSLTLVLGRKLWRNPIFRDSIQLYQGAINIQSLQLVLYPAISVLYDHVDDTFKLAIVVLFPGVKYLLKRLIYRFTRHAGEGHSELISVVAMSIVLGVDVVMAFVSIKLFLDHHSEQLDVPRSQFISEASRRLHEQQIVAVGISPCGVVPVKPVSNSIRKRSSRATAPDKVVVAALRITDSAERILLVEYYEVVVPLVNSVFLLIATQFPSAQYNPRHVALYHDPPQLQSALRQIWLYSFH
ncbi:hypothetical protein Poli38472_011062 [Pythium oligandrum]|uniref:Uncharacterized protein n=1 Tax=Pythium oligandrum TaxID=41045 RepID=A0A8K1FQ04_PYTOL|nr:hypothetical protein Poli38472_011062 [Pythium oligandrum]|eukprot:TMW67442.1 hypothetical protein Poli38472_011062 [Pythium oligandrum]